MHPNSPVTIESEFSPEELAYWEAQVEPEWRTPEREAPVVPKLAIDIYEGRRIAPRTMSVLRGTKTYKRPSLMDPDIPRWAAEPLEAVLTSEEHTERARLPLLVRRMLRHLPAKECAVVRLRFGIGGPPLGVQETADQLGYCRTTVWQAERRALELLAGAADGDEMALAD